MVTIGLPGCGKSTKAREWRDADPEKRIVTDRDELRMMLYGKAGLILEEWREEIVSNAQYSIVRDAFERGLSVAIADTNLRPERLAPLLELADLWHARVEYIDLRHVPVDVCIANDFARGARGGRYVGGLVIKAMAEKYGLLPEETK
jgi:predicted kinase